MGDSEGVTLCERVPELLAVEDNVRVCETDKDAVGDCDGVGVGDVLLLPLCVRLCEMLTV